jgi:hypothetical protein
VLNVPIELFQIDAAQQTSAQLLLLIQVGRCLLCDHALSQLQRFLT